MPVCIWPRIAGAAGSLTSITYSTPTPSEGSLEISTKSLPTLRSTSSFSKCGSGRKPTCAGASALVTSYTASPRSVDTYIVELSELNRAEIT